MAHPRKHRYWTTLWVMVDQHCGQCGRKVDHIAHFKDSDVYGPCPGCGISVCDVCDFSLFAGRYCVDCLTEV